jgi:hypothetical protein
MGDYTLLGMPLSTQHVIFSTKICINMRQQSPQVERKKTMNNLVVSLETGNIPRRLHLRPLKKDIPDA